MFSGYLIPEDEGGYSSKGENVGTALTQARLEINGGCKILFPSDLMVTRQPLFIIYFLALYNKQQTEVNVRSDEFCNPEGNNQTAQPCAAARVHTHKHTEADYLH